MSDYYEILGVSPSSDDVVIRAAYRAMMLKYHPDTNGGPEAERKAREINEAFAVLSDPAKRRIYDAGRLAAPLILDMDQELGKSATRPQSGFSPEDKKPAILSRIGNSKSLNIGIVIIAVIMGYIYIYPVIDRGVIEDDPLKYLPSPSHSSSILDLLRSGDLSVCNRPEILSLINKAGTWPFKEMDKEYGVTQAEYDDMVVRNPVLANVTASDVNRDIAEVTCQGTGVDSENGTIGTFVVRPSGDKKSFVILWDDNLRRLLAWHGFSQDSLFRKLHPRAPANPVPTQAAPEEPSPAEESLQLETEDNAEVGMDVDYE